ncbi:hypothetical protein [Halobaculum lipolyticum]|uniref:Uncharacterized protein n=1 Tax=Halobaculum lipolyticum TaxID=3032001 RepID=A0ABD5WI25_9EURY|nr:hypothetical protein [Halobaculum sp. DT31]
MSRRAPTRTGTTATTRSTAPPRRSDTETDAPLVPNLTRTGRPDRTDTTTDTATDRAERRRRRDPFEIALMEDSE